MSSASGVDNNDLAKPSEQSVSAQASQLDGYDKDVEVEQDDDDKPPPGYGGRGPREPVTNAPKGKPGIKATAK